MPPTPPDPGKDEIYSCSTSLDLLSAPLRDDTVLAALARVRVASLRLPAGTRQRSYNEKMVAKASRKPRRAARHSRLPSRHDAWAFRKSLLQKNFLWRDSNSCITVQETAILTHIIRQHHSPCPSFILHKPLDKQTSLFSKVRAKSTLHSECISMCSCVDGSALGKLARTPPPQVALQRVLGMHRHTCLQRENTADVTDFCDLCRGGHHWPHSLNLNLAHIHAVHPKEAQTSVKSDQIWKIDEISDKGKMLCLLRSASCRRREHKTDVTAWGRHEHCTGISKPHVFVLGQLIRST